MRKSLGIRKVLVMLLAFIMCIPVMASASEVEADSKAWYDDAIQQGISMGYLRDSEVSTTPDKDLVSKIEFIVVISRAKGLYDDTSEEFYISKYNHFNALVENGIIVAEDYPEDGWATPLGRFEAAEICGNILSKIEGYKPLDGVSYLSVIPDSSSIPDKYKSQVDTAYNAGILTGVDGTLKVAGWNGVTKAESYVIMHRMTDSSIRKAADADWDYAKLFGSYSTKYGKAYDNYRAGSIFNMARAGEIIDEHIVEPGETFSFNEVVGNPGKSNGFKQGYVLSGGKLVPGYGGGVCQASTTLFNAALKANMEILERHNHGSKPSYVPGGADSSIVYSSWDLKFKNNYSCPIKIVFTNNPDNTTLTFEIYGSAKVYVPTVEYSTSGSGKSYKLTRTADGEVNYTCSTRYRK